MTYTADQLMQLLPVIYRQRDDVNGGALAGLMAIVAQQAEIVSQDIGGLYENWFIETCEEWVVPYIADLIGVRNLHAVDATGFSLRAFVANALLYRQRKGTPSALEQLARDITGWPAKVVEFFSLLDTTQHTNHPRLANFRTPDLRDADQLELLDSPFDTAAHTADVRHISDQRGKHNIPNIGIFLWRLQSYQVPRSHAAQAAAANDGRFLFDPLGASLPLFNFPQEASGAGAQEVNVPGPLRGRPLYAELEARRQAFVDDLEVTPQYFTATPPFGVWLDGVALLPEEIAICDLSDPPTAIPDGWYRPAARSFVQTGTGKTITIKVGIDVARGRLALPEGATAGVCEVGYCYGFPGDTGAGPYNRRVLLKSWFEAVGRQVDWQIGVTKNNGLLASAPDPSQLVTTLAAAIAAWDTFIAAHPGSFGLIAKLDSDTYTEDLTAAAAVEVPAGATLAIVAADWPVVTNSLGGNVRRTGDYVPNRLRPHLAGNISARGVAGPIKGNLILDGLLLEGNLTILVGDLGKLSLGHMSLVPSAGKLTVNPSSDPASQNTELEIVIRNSICGPIALPNTLNLLDIADSIVDGGAGQAIAAPGVPAQIQTSTVLGTSAIETLSAGNSIFTGLVTASRRQAGCVRYCLLPDASTTSQRFRCQPDMALQAEPDPANDPAIRARLVPTFGSVVFGQPDYCQLTANCAPEIVTGAEDGSEMGAFSFLKQPQRETNLQTSLDEYLRFGLEAGIFFVS